MKKELGELNKQYHSLRELKAEVGQFVAWEGSDSLSPVAMIISKKYYQGRRNEVRYDRWSIAPILLGEDVTGDYCFIGRLGVLVDPDSPQFSKLTDELGAKQILIEKLVKSGRLKQEEIQQIITQDITIRR